METDAILHGDTSGDLLAKCEVYYTKFKAKFGKQVYALFEQFKTDGVDMAKLDQLIMQKKSKSFYSLEKKKGL